MLADEMETDKVKVMIVTRLDMSERIVVNGY
jgi:hypothetical protein